VDRRRRFAVIMAGGSGTRFWPWSREAKPKQLLALTSSTSMLAETVSRLKGVVPPSNIVVVTSRRYRRQVAGELPRIAKDCILAEPVGRNTAACIGWAATEIRRRCPDAVMAVLSADHRIGGRSGAFGGDLAKALEVADRTRRLVTFGIRPESPATGYGYIRAGAAVRGAAGAREVDAFVEKPKAAVARRYVANSNYYWNCGIFAWRADVILEEIAGNLPELASGLARLEATRRGRSIPAKALDRIYGELPAISIDYGVLEKSRRVAMVPASFSWSDIGSWDSVAELWPADRNANATRDPLLALDSGSNIVASGGKPVVLLGVDNLVVVDAGDALMVCARERCQDLRSVVARLAEAGLGELR
jgi:mannose-1-phosphate guanylyltransferase